MDETVDYAEESLEQVVHGVLWQSMHRFLRPYPIALWPAMRHDQLTREGTEVIMLRITGELASERAERVRQNAIVIFTDCIEAEQAVERAKAEAAATHRAFERRIRLDKHQVLAQLNEPGITKDELLRRIGERYRELDQEGS